MSFLGPDQLGRLVAHWQSLGLSQKHIQQRLNNVSTGTENTRTKYIFDYLDEQNQALAQQLQTLKENAPS